MQNIRRLSFAFIMFSLCSVSYLVKPVFAEVETDSLTDKCEQHASLPQKTEQVNCLRSLLSETAPNFITPSKDGLGNWGCGNSDRAQHVDCLKNLLYQHTNGGTGMHQMLETHSPAAPILEPHGAPPATKQHIDSASVTQRLDGRVGDLENQLSAATAAQEHSKNRIAALESQLSEATTAQEPLNTRIADFEAQLSAASAAQGPLNARIADLEGQLSAASAAQEPLNARIADLETQLSAASAAQGPLNARIADLERKLSAASQENLYNEARFACIDEGRRAGKTTLHC